MAKIDDIIFKEPTPEEIEKWNEERRQRVDYEVGDWVETCHMTPGIVQEIDIEHDCVSVYYPSYGFREDCIGIYNGYSHCSIDNCAYTKSRLSTPSNSCLSERRFSAKNGMNSRS